MVHNEIHTIDLLIIAAYLIAMVLIGLVVVRKVRNMDDYYLGGRSFGPLVLMATVCATIIGGSGLMGRAGVAYSSGFKAIMTALPYLLGMFIFSGFAGRISAVGTTFGVSSIPDLFEQRFGKSAKVTLGALIAFTMMGTVASQVTATATIINMLGNEIGISYEMGAIIACCVFIIYTATSGLFGVIYTDVFQFVMLILFVYILIPASSLAKLGGTHIRPVEHIPRLQKYPRRKAQAAPELLPRLWEAPRKLRAYAGIQRLEAAGIPQPQDAELPALPCRRREIRAGAQVVLRLVPAVALERLQR